MKIYTYRCIYNTCIYNIHRTHGAKKTNNQGPGVFQNQQIKPVVPKAV